LISYSLFFLFLYNEEKNTKGITTRQTWVSETMSKYSPICGYCYKEIPPTDAWVAEGEVAFADGRPFLEHWEDNSEAREVFGIVTPPPPSPAHHCCTACSDQKRPIGSHYDFMKSTEMYFVIKAWVKLRPGDTLDKSNGVLKVIQRNHY
jgi:hypothetical protein